jgi:uncharacterized protein
MRGWRPVVIAAGIVVAMGGLLALSSAIATFYAGIATLSPTLARLLTLLLVGLLIAAIGILLYYGYLFLRPRRARKLPAPPKTVTAAVEANLASIDQQVAQIQDEVARQALQVRSQTLTQTLTQTPSRRAFEIVIFGPGAAGKTALANALMGEAAGKIAPTMGTTTTPQTYRLAVNDLDREIWLTDSPGILDLAGSEREGDARQAATTADLVLYVIDNDLHRVQYEALYQLCRLGKRTMVAFNKIDRYSEAEVEQIVQRLQERLSGVLKSEDIVAIAAHPAPFALEDGTWYQSDPDINALIDRIVTVLTNEGEDLIADNLLLQSKRLGDDTRAILAAQRQRQADNIIDRYQWISAGVLAATPLPGLDLLATAAINAQMVVELGKVYGINVSIEDAKTLAWSLAKTLTGLGIVKGAIKLLSLGLKLNIATAIANKALQGVSAAYLTRIAGKSFIDYFLQNQDWGDGGIQAVVEKHYQLNRREDFVREFLQTAVERVKGESMPDAITRPT